MFGGGAVVALFAVLTCCTKVDDHLGLDFIPPYQSMQVCLDTISVGINTYLTKSDSIASSNSGVSYLGGLNHKKFGRTIVGSLNQYLPTYRTDTVETGGINEVPDSMWLVGTFHYIAGDTNRKQTFNVYEVIGELSNDSTYYTSFDVDGYIDPTPIFTFDMQGKPAGTTYDTLVFKVADQVKARDFMDRLAGMERPYYLSDSLWLTKLRGLYFRPADNTPKNAAVYSMGLGLDDNDSYIALFSHNYDPNHPSIPQDTIMRYYTFYDDVDYARSVSLTNIEHDYTGTEFAPIADYLDDLGAPSSKVAVQGFAGMTTTLEFDDSFYDALSALIPEGYNVMINKAELVLPTTEITPDAYNHAPERVGAYTHYASRSGIVDYNWYYENEYGVNLSYGGYLNRSHGRYEADLSSYVQRMFTQAEDDQTKRRITFGMPAYHVFRGGEVELSGTGGERPIKMAITYTLYKKSSQN